MKKIAITGGDNKTRSIIVHALSLVTSFPIVRPSSFSNISIKYGLSDKIEKCDFRELFIYMLSTYTERIIIEQYFDTFISDGLSLHDLSEMEQYYSEREVNKRKKEEMMEMCDSIKKIIIGYVIEKYDLIIHIQANKEEQQIKDHIIESYFDKYNLPVVIYNEKNIINILERILQKIDIKSSISSKSAINKALTLI